MTLVIGMAERARAFSCDASKRFVTARAAATKLRCYAAATRKGSDYAPCLARVDERMAVVFAHAEARGGCSTTGNEESIRSYIGALTSTVVGLLQPQPGNRCVVVKLSASARRLAGIMRCPSGNAACLETVVERFARGFAHAERRVPCVTVGDVEQLGDLIDVGASDLLSLLATGAVPPGSAPSNLQAVVVGTEVQLTWTNPVPPSLNTEVKLVRRLNAPPTSATDPLATLVFSGSAMAASDPITALLPDVPENGRTYHYAVFGCTPTLFCETSGSRTTLTPTLAETLRGGGYVLYFRHAIATTCTDLLDLGPASTTTSPDWWKSCDANCGTATARQLTFPGATNETTAVRAFFDARALPVGRVLSSEFCRCKTTAELMEFGPVVETSPLITFSVYDDVQDRCATSRALTRTAPDAGTNTAIVTHIGIACDDLGTLATSEALIFKPDGVGGATQVTRVTWDEWGTLP